MKMTRKKLIQKTLYPLTLTLALLFTWLFKTEAGISMLAVFLVIVSANALIWVMEFKLPYNLSWRPGKKTLKLDIFYSLMAALVITPALKTLLLYGFTKLNIQSLNIWPSDLPIGIQVLLAVICTDFFIYWFHRLCHRGELGWRIHVVHHTPSKLHFWASARTHPINLIIFYSTEALILLYLGVSADVIALCTVFISINGQFEHCNIDLKPGILSKIFQTCETHRVHHSPNWKYSNSNFGNQTVIWDHVFGTYLIPKEKIKEVGIKMHQIPENFISHMKAPFKLNKFKI